MDSRRTRFADVELPELQRLVPDFQILVDDLVRQPDDELQRRELPPFPKVVLWVLRDARTIQRFYSHLAAWGEELARLTQEAPEDAATIMRYIIGVVGDQSFEDIHKRIVEVVPATEKVMATAAQELIQRGRAEGKAEGRVEGKAEGRAEEKLRAFSSSSRLATFRSAPNNAPRSSRARMLPS